jgi:hypothetical protein
MEIDTVVLDCVQMGSHKGHNVTPITKAAKDVLPKLQECVSSMQLTLKTIITNADRCILEMLTVRTAILLALLIYL